MQGKKAGAGTYIHIRLRECLSERLRKRLCERLHKGSSEYLCKSVMINRS